MTTNKRPERNAAEHHDGSPTQARRAAASRAGRGDDTWLSGEDEHDPQREEAAWRGTFPALQARGPLIER
jgi:hypothetical protein